MVARTRLSVMFYERKFPVSYDVDERDSVPLILRNVHF
jgi:hypothetical protein